MADSADLLQDELARYYDNLSIGILVTDAELNLLFANNWIRDRFSSDQLRAKSFAEIIPKEKRTGLGMMIRDTIGKKTYHVLSHAIHSWTIPLPASNSDGGHMPQSCVLSPFCRNGQTYAMLQIRDESDTLFRIRRLRQNQEKLVETNKILEKYGAKLEKANITLLEKRATQLETLRKIGLEMTSHLNPEALLDIVVTRTWETLGGRSSALFLCQPDGRLMELVAVAGRHPAEKGGRFPRDRGFFGKIFSARKSILTHDSGSWKDLPGYEIVASAAGAPILSGGGNLIGILMVESDLRGCFSDEDTDFLGLLAVQAAVAIRNVHLFEQMQRDAETKATLLCEVNHRVGNNLMAIGGLLALERRHMGSTGKEIYREIMEDLTNRVNCLGKVHGMLSACGWSPVCFDELAAKVIHSSLRMLPSEKCLILEITPSDIEVTAKEAHHLALILNELTTNVIKYALCDRAVGRITVMATHGNGQPRFEFRDDGPGYPETTLRLERVHVGIDLIRQLTRRDLRGGFTLHNSPGATAVVWFRSQQSENE